MKDFNTSNIYTLLYVSSMYGVVSICSDPGNSVGAFVRIPILFLFFIAHYYWYNYFLTYSIFAQFAIYIFVLVIFIYS